MNSLVDEISQRVRDRVQTSVRNLQGPTAELRSVFHGPPLHFLRRIFERLSGDGGIQALLPDSATVRVPVVLLVDALPEGTFNPQIGTCGECDANHFLNMRNSPECPRFVALIPPDRHTNLSFASASDEFGISADNNSGNATINDWWRDDLVQDLVEAALGRGAWASEKDKEQARSLVERAAHAADEVDRHDVSRPHAWCILSRLFSIPSSAPLFPTFVSLATGFPPMEDGTIRVDEQAKVLKRLSGDLEEEGFRTALARIKVDSDPADQVALDSFLSHLQAACELPTRLLSRYTVLLRAESRRRTRYGADVVAAPYGTAVARVVRRRIRTGWSPSTRVYKLHHPALPWNNGVGP